MCFETVHRWNNNVLDRSGIIPTLANPKLYQLVHDSFATGR